MKNRSMDMGEWSSAISQDGTAVPMWVFGPEAEQAKAAFLMMPALGVPARFYRRLAAGLAGQGIRTFVMEQRGHGESPVRARRGDSFGYRAFLEEDIPAALVFARSHIGQLPLYIGGHSLGGHFAAITAGRDQNVAGVVQLACGFPYHGLYDKAAAGKVRLLCRLIGPSTRLFGYFPGTRIGFGAREYRQLMLDWRDWALGGSYDIPATPNAEAEIAAFTGPVLSLSFDRDFFASDEAIRYSHSRFKGATVTALRLTEAEQGDHLGHFDWAKQPTGAVQAIVNWMN